MVWTMHSRAISYAIQVMWEFISEADRLYMRPTLRPESLSPMQAIEVFWQSGESSKPEMQSDLHKISRPYLDIGYGFFDFYLILKLKRCKNNMTDTDILCIMTDFFTGNGIKSIFE